MAQISLRIDDEVKKRVNYDDTEIRNMICDTNASLDNKANKSEVDNNINELDVIKPIKTNINIHFSKMCEIFIVLLSLFFYLPCFLY